MTITWWRKEGDEYRNTLRELQRPKVGRMARLKGTVEQVVPPLAMIADAAPEHPASRVEPERSATEDGAQRQADVAGSSLQPPQILVLSGGDIDKLRQLLKDAGIDVDAAVRRGVTRA